MMHYVAIGRIAESKRCMVLRDERQAMILRQARASGFVRISDLAAQLATSRATLWRDIDALAADGLLVKVHGGATVPPSDSSDDRPDDAADEQAVRSADSLIIGMQVPSGEYYYQRVIEGARNACDLAGAQLIVGVSGYGGLDDDHEVIRGLIDSGAHGLMLSPATSPYDASGLPQRWLDDIHQPIVLVEREPPGIASAGISSVSTAHEAGIHSAILHLKQFGHQRIGLVALRVNSQTRKRIQVGYRMAIEQLFDVDDPPLYEWIASDDITHEDILLEMRDAGVTAVVCFNDVLAASLARRARTMNWTVPGDLSIVSYDNEIAANVAPPMTAISPQREVLGRLAAHRLIRQLSANESINGPRVRVDPELVIRESTGEVRLSRR